MDAVHCVTVQFCTGKIEIDGRVLVGCLHRLDGTMDFIDNVIQDSATPSAKQHISVSQ